MNNLARAEIENYDIILNSLKDKIRLSRQRAIVAVNTGLLIAYWEIGNTILQQQKLEGWGTKVIAKLATDLRAEFPEMKGFSERNFKYMRAFAEAYPSFVQQAAAQMQSKENQHFIIVQQLAAQLGWGHHQLLLDKIKSPEERVFYIRKTVQNGWSRNILLHQIEGQLYQRQGKAITNFESTLPVPQSDLAKETLKSPYLFDFLGISEEMKERELEKVLIQHIKKFMLELGRGFAYVGNQYNLQIEGDEYFLDLLFFNYHLDCFVVFELKVSEFKPEFAGKLNFYINTVDAQVKAAHHKPTIGVLLCKTPNDTVVKYALKGIDGPIGVADYELTNSLPKQLRGEIPTIEELEQEIEKETTEFKEQLNPIDSRLQALKEKLKSIKTEEIQTPVSYKILQELFTNGLKPLYLKLIDKLSREFEEEFLTQKLYWTCNKLVVSSIGGIEVYWGIENHLKQINELDFTYQLYGFKKAGTEDFGEQQTLRFEFREYWYGFTLLNHNNQQPFIKKLYHQSITNEDQQQVVDLIMTKVMDKIEWILEFMKRREQVDKV
jgi:predicted nuclease of restriction endonuclease-like (RecB) superfamily